MTLLNSCKSFGSFWSEFQSISSLCKTPLLSAVSWRLFQPFSVRKILLVSYGFPDRVIQKSSTSKVETWKKKLFFWDSWVQSPPRMLARHQMTWHFYACGSQPKPSLSTGILGRGVVPSDNLLLNRDHYNLWNWNQKKTISMSKMGSRRFLDITYEIEIKKNDQHVKNGIPKISRWQGQKHPATFNLKGTNRIIEWKTRPLYVEIMQSHIEEQAIFVLSIYVVSILRFF